MSEPRLSDMCEAEFDALIEGHIGRLANSDHALPADVFIDLLLARREAREKRHSEGIQTNNTGHPSRANSSGRRARRLS